MLGIDNVRHGKRTRAARVVVALDRRLVERLEEIGLWRAYVNICKALTIRTAGLGVCGSDYSRVRGTHGSDYGAELLVEYDRWANLIRRSKYSLDMVLDMALEGLSLRAIDRKRGRATGTASNNLIECLRLWG